MIVKKESLDTFGSLLNPVILLSYKVNNESHILKINNTDRIISRTHNLSAAIYNTITPNLKKKKESS